MKRILNIGALIILVSSLISCNDLLDINTDPDVANTAPPRAMVASAEARLAIIMDMRFNDQAKLWAQYWTWGPGVSLGPGDKHEYVNSTSSNAPGAWRDAYARALQDLKFVTENANPAMQGVASLLSTFIYGMLVDHHGDIPYSQALAGAENASPAYDDDAAVYLSLLDDIDAAIASIEASTENELIEGDAIYSGDKDAWITFAHSLKLKLLMRMSENGGPADLATRVADVLASGTFVTSNSQNAEYPWTGVSGAENPMYSDMESGLGNFYILSQTALNILEDLADPRLDVLYDTPANGGGHVAVAQGDILNVGGQTADFSTPSGNVYSAGRNTLLMSATEVLFYQAEAAERFGTGDPVALFEAAITASFDFYNASGAAAYIASLNYDSSPNRLRELAIQMWVAFNGIQMAEGWATTRKFDNASRPIFASPGGQFISPSTNSLGVGVFPSILQYPQEEADLNANFPGQNLLTGKVFWDN